MSRRRLFNVSFYFITKYKEQKIRPQPSQPAWLGCSDYSVLEDRTLESP